MDFERVLRDLVPELHARRVRYGLIGGFAMGALGIPRATMDLDFLVHRDDLSALDSIMDQHLYRLAYRSENVSQFVSDLAPLGQVDFLHAFRRISTGMLERAAEIAAFSGSLSVRTLLPDDIVGLKVQALANDPSRERQDLVDIHLLAERFSADLDWERLREYFSLFERSALYDEIKRAHGPTERG